MFVRKVKNRSGSTSVQVIAKNAGAYRIVKSFGATRDPEELASRLAAARQYIQAANRPAGQAPLLSALSAADLAVKNALGSLSNPQIRVKGPELIFGRLYDEIGFSQVECGELFRHLVIARLAYPGSKLKTIDYLYRYQGLRVPKDRIYRFLDRLASTYKAPLEAVAFTHTKKLLGGVIAVVFYDMTTLYFEAEDPAEETDIRRIGFSKDGKNQCPQIMIGLLVGPGGYPIGYDIFPGNTFEGGTLVPTLEQLAAKYQLGKPVIVADSALLSQKNLEALTQAGYRYILGARIKNESQEIKRQILAKARELKAQPEPDGQRFTLKRPDKPGTPRLIVTYSLKRSKKDAHNREKGLRRLKAKLTSGKLTKKHIQNRGNNKFLELEGEANIKLDEAKVRADLEWDGLKGYLTNAEVSDNQAVSEYSHLWQIEKAFRISKTDLKVRPIFHHL